MEHSISVFRLRRLPKTLKYVVLLYLASLTFGLITATLLIEYTTELTPDGIEANYIGNEEDEQAEEMKFKKSAYEIMNIIHTHVLGLGLILFVQAVLLYFTEIPEILKKILMIEPLVSVIVTFFSIYLLWTNVPYTEYVIILSGSLMVTCMLLGAFLIGRELLAKSRIKT